MQFGFMAGRGTTDALFEVPRMQEKYRNKKKKLYMRFVDIRKHLIEFQEGNEVGDEKERFRA